MRILNIGTDPFIRVTKIKNGPIALVGPLPPPSGGMANQAELLYDCLSSGGIKIVFIRTNCEYRPNWIKNIRGLRAIFRLVFYFVEIWFTAKHVKLFHVLSNSGWSWYLFSVPVLVIAKSRGVPVMINYRGGEAETFFKRSWRWVKPTLKLATLITVPTGYLQQVFKKRGIETAIVPNIINLKQFSPSAKTDKQRLHIIVTRNLEQIYGIDTVIRSFAKLVERFPNAILTVAGSGPQLQALKDLRASLSLNDKVNFIGRLNRDQMAALYQSADLMLNASHVDNSPNSIIEALASGVPVVSSSVGGIPFLVSHDMHALLLSENIEKEMASASIRLIEDTTLRKKLIANGVELARKFDWNSVRPVLMASYESTLNSYTD